MTDGVLTGGSFEVDMTALLVTDLEGEWKEKLEGHLKSEDFFGIEKYPTAKFVVTKVAPKGTPGDYKVYGDLTIKETTEPIAFYANITEEDGVKVATADLEIDRSKYNVRYGSGSFFSGLGDKTIYDEFDLQVKLVVE
jgi:polyisoprenoid-binding protein YceI